MSTMNSPNPTPFELHPNSHIAHVELQVTNLKNMLLFYQELMGFHLLEDSDGRVALSAGPDSPALLTLVEKKDALPQPSSTPGVGLYHTAFRFTDRRSLATALLRIVAGGWQLQGAADHHVSEAIYFADPEGNGIETYRDRPRSEWPRLQDGIRMGNAPLDLNKLIQEADQEAAKRSQVNPGMDIGHIHLQVSDLAKADSFYRQLLGMDVMMAMPTALFMAAGGYHHHIGANVWHSLGAPSRNPEATGLNSFAISVPDADGWTQIFQRVQASSYGWQPIDRDGRPGIRLTDQDGLSVEILAPQDEVIRSQLAEAMAQSV